MSIRAKAQRIIEARTAEGRYAVAEVDALAVASALAEILDSEERNMKPASPRSLAETPRPKMNPWFPTTDPASLRRLGKLSEELAELQAVVARIIIQGIDGTDPASGQTNRQRLQNEIADVYAQLSLAVMMFKFDTFMIDMRSKEKIRQMAEWEAHFQQGG